MKTLRSTFLSVILLFILFSSIAQENEYYVGENEVYIEIHFKNFKGKPLVRENVTLTETRSGLNKKFTSNASGIIKFVAHYGEKYDISFKHDKHYAELLTPKTRMARPMIVTVVYEGTAYIEKREKDREEFEKMALERWKTKDAVKFKEDLDKYSGGDYNFEKETVLKVFKRNPHWKDKLIVTDITGSMYPYVGQVLLWFKLNYLNEKATKLAFFNDGDQKDELEKEIGKAGGIYYCPDCDVESLTDTMISAMVGGYGGRCPENDLEAVIRSANEMPKFKELILIADNNSPVRDIELLNKVKVPVRIILCGVNDRVSFEYLKIAYRTKGSVHTIEEDITSIALLKEGEKILIGGRGYKLVNGEFILVSGQ